MKLLRITTLLIALAAATPSCKGPGYIRVEGIETSVLDVCARHDQYVAADTTLPNPANALGESAALRALVSGNEKVHVSKIEPAFIPVGTRYDAYVSADPAVSLIKDHLLRTTEILRKVFQEARR